MAAAAEIMETPSAQQGSELVSWGCCNKVPQTEWHKTTEMYPLIVREARSPNSRCHQGHSLQRLQERTPLPFSVSGIPWLVVASLQLLPLSFRLLLCTCQVSLHLSLIRTLGKVLRAHLDKTGKSLLRLFNLISSLPLWEYSLFGQIKVIFIGSED